MVTAQFQGQGMGQAFRIRPAKAVRQDVKRPIARPEVTGPVPMLAEIDAPEDERNHQDRQCEGPDPDPRAPSAHRRPSHVIGFGLVEDPRIGKAGRCMLTPRPIRDISRKRN
jgi:hypothetical protein